jgi:pseudaminic acid synthase
MSANHGHDFDQATRLIYAAKEVGADAIKLQTYTPDTITIDCRNEFFQIKGTIWEGKNLYDLYGEAFTPWDWQPKLKEIANSVGLDCFSTPFDSTAVDFLEAMEVPAHKIASFELVDLALIQKVAQTGKPVIMSTGMASLQEIHEAVDAFREAGGTQLALLKCTSAYPSAPEEMNLKTIPNLVETFGVPVGLSDHTLGHAVPVAAIAMGACIVEKHFTLSRSLPGPDRAFSLEPAEFAQMVKAVREVEPALGKVNYEASPHEQSSRIFRRSLFVVRDIEPGEAFTPENVRSIRPGYGLAPKHLHDVLRGCATKRISAGTPLEWDLVEIEQGA